MSGVQGVAAATASPAASGLAGQATQLAGNFQTFLQLLLTQLRNQDPSSPLDSNQFTSELVQFASVEQQMNTNSSLTQLLQLSAGEATMQGAQFVGHVAEVTSDHIPIQGGAGAVRFNLANAQPVQISISAPSGRVVYTDVVQGAAGDNAWTLPPGPAGQATLPDGDYAVAVTSVAPDGAAAAIPFTVLGRVTGVGNQSGKVTLQLGTLNVDIGALRQIGD